jgi:hypothetical protein
MDKFAAFLKGEIPVKDPATGLMFPPEAGRVVDRAMREGLNMTEVSGNTSFISIYTCCQW